MKYKKRTIDDFTFEQIEKRKKELEKNINKHLNALIERFNRKKGEVIFDREFNDINGHYERAINTAEKFGIDISSYQKKYENLMDKLDRVNQEIIEIRCKEYREKKIREEEEKREKQLKKGTWTIPVINTSSLANNLTHDSFYKL